MTPRPITLGEVAAMDVADLQQAIDRLDDELIALLQQRFVCSRQIGALKQQGGQPPIDQARVASQRQRFLGRCADSGLDPQMSRQLLRVITDQVIAERLGKAAT
jgi:chorismate mutase